RTEPATAFPASDPGNQARYGRYSRILGRAVLPYRCSTGFRKFSDTIDSTNNPINSSRVLRFASIFSSHDPISRSSVTFISTNSALTPAITGSTSGRAIAAPRIIAATQQTDDTAAKSANP